ncbi:Uncharacterised protein [uncultured archaeon]|nr:Uncharacterised protein [uncultured archaeon]
MKHLHWIKKFSSWVNSGAIAIKSKIPNAWTWQSWVNLGTIAAIPALILSVYTFILLYYEPGTIEINMPDEIALNLNQSPGIQVYATFSNDGSPSTWKIIRNINARGWIHRKGKPDEEIKFDWKYVYRFVGIEDYEHNYIKPNETISNDTNFFTIFESAKAPFTVPGKGTVSKLLVFKSYSGGFNFSEPFTFEVEIEGTTMDNNIYKSPKISYYGNNVDAVTITTRTIYGWLHRE